MIKSADYHKLQTRLTQKAGRNNFPIDAMFELTYLCNLKCRHCYVVPAKNSGNNHRQRELNTKEVFIILDKLALAGCLNLGFTGGEPFARRDFLDILKYAKDKGFNIIVLTNGTFITSKIVDKLKELGLNKIDISFHTTNAKTFDWFTKVPQTYAKVLRSIKLLRKNGIEVFLKTTAMTINKEDIINIRQLAIKKMGAHFRFGPVVSPRWDRTKDNLKFRLSAKEIIQLEREINSNGKGELPKLKPLESLEKKKEERCFQEGRSRQLFRCGAGKTEVVIDPYGQMRLCIDLPFPKYNILRGDFALGWRMLRDYVKNACASIGYRCRDCEFIAYCCFCPARGWLECSDLSACPSYDRELARLSKMEWQKQMINA